MNKERIQFTLYQVYWSFYYLLGINCENAFKKLDLLTRNNVNLQNIFWMKKGNSFPNVQGILIVLYTEYSFFYLSYQV